MIVELSKVVTWLDAADRAIQLFAHADDVAMDSYASSVSAGSVSITGVTSNVWRPANDEQYLDNLTATGRQVWQDDSMAAGLATRCLLVAFPKSEDTGELGFCLHMLPLLRQ